MRLLISEEVVSGVCNCRFFFMFDVTLLYFERGKRECLAGPSHNTVCCITHTVSTKVDFLLCCFLTILSEKSLLQSFIVVN